MKQLSLGWAKDITLPSFVELAGEKLVAVDGTWLSVLVVRLDFEAGAPYSPTVRQGWQRESRRPMVAGVQPQKRRDHSALHR